MNAYNMYIKQECTAELLLIEVALYFFYHPYKYVIQYKLPNAHQIEQDTCVLYVHISKPNNLLL